MAMLKNVFKRKKLIEKEETDQEEQTQPNAIEETQVSQDVVKTFPPLRSASDHERK